MPLKGNGALFILAALITFIVVKSEFYGTDSFFNPYLELFAWVLGVFILLIISIGLIYTLICWIYFLMNKSIIEPDFKIGLEDGQKGVAGKVAFQLSFSKIMMPIFGYIKVRIAFENGDITEPIVLNAFTEGWKDLLPKEGNANLWLSERRQYNVKGFIITFEDYLQFFAFSTFKKSKKSFYIYSPVTELETSDIKPSKSQEMVERVKTSKKVEGDYLNYKDFESGDDVRRIVWKIFAKNRELVVRIPEVINPYASHIHFYSSFYNTLSTNFESRHTKGMLNYYKDIMYNVCSSLQKRGREVKLNIDQAIGDSIVVEKKDELKYKLSCAQWQHDVAASDLPISTSESVLCVSSLMPVADLKELIGKNPTTLFIVRASKYLDHQLLFNWKNLFLRVDGKNELSKLKWLVSGLRRTIKRNEKHIEKIVSDNNFQGQLI